MVEHGENRLGMSLRRNRGRRIVGEWTAGLQRVLGVSVTADSFLSLRQTESLKRSFFQRLKDGKFTTKTSYWTKEEQPILARLLQSLGSKAGPKMIVLFSEVDPFVGAIRVPANSVLQNAFGVWEFVGEDLSLASESLNSGLCLEENFYDGEGRYFRTGVYQLTT